MTAAAAIQAASVLRDLPKPTAGRRRTALFAAPQPEPRGARSAAAAEALEELNESVRPALLRFFRRRATDAADAEDMVQKVFERLLRRGALTELNNPKSYAFQTAASVLKDRLRRRRARFADAHEAFDCERHVLIAFSPEQVLLAREQLDDVKASLAELPPRTRAVFLLRRCCGMKLMEIAGELGISLSAVEKHFARASGHISAYQAAPPSLG